MSPSATIAGAPTGATVHYMDEGLDTGDIAAQTVVPLPDGISGPEAERTLALAGLGLLRGVLDERRVHLAVRRHQAVAAEVGVVAGLAEVAAVREVAVGSPAARDCAISFS